MSWMQNFGKRNKGYRFSLSLTLLFFLSACGGAEQATPAGSPTAPALPTNTIQLTSTPLPATATLLPAPGATLLVPTGTPAAESSASPVVSVGFPDPGGYAWQTVVAGLNTPIGLTNAGDGSGRLFVIEKAGQIRIVQDNAILPDPFLDIRDRVGNESSEQGLLGLAFHPRYIETGYFYVNYTDMGGNTVIARFQVTPDNLNTADPQSELQLLTQEQPYANHNGGATAFGPDGFLYLGLGDGGSGGDPQNNGQSTQTWLGKVLRIDVDGGDPYAIPEGNPFMNEANSRPEIWAYGLRNPWRFSFDRQTGDFYIGDVGQNTFEEIDFKPAGSPGGTNFGWNIMEGEQCYNQDVVCDPNGLALPVAVYATHEGGSCAVTGGYVYRGPSLPEWNGIYLFSDYCSGTIWGLFRDGSGSWQQSTLFESGANVASFGEDEAGEIYLVDMNGALLRLVQKP